MPKKNICCTTDEGIPVTKWHKVTGVISNVIANLWYLGWNPLTFNSWVDTKGFQWTIPSAAGEKPVCLHLLVQELQDNASTILWRQAATRWQSAGIENGVAYAYTMKLLWKGKNQ